MIHELFASVRLLLQGPVVWRIYLPNPGARIYVLVKEGEVVYIGQYPHSAAQRLHQSDRQQSAALWAYWASTNDPSRAEAEMLYCFRRHFNRLPSGNRQ